MHLRVLWTLVLLGLPRLAAADGATDWAAEPIPLDSHAVIEGAETPAVVPSSELDLRFDPMQLPLSQNPPTHAHAIEAKRADRYTGADQPPADRGLSFDVEVRPRSQTGNLARKDDVEDPGLSDQIQKVIERPAIGVRGRYRF